MNTFTVQCLSQSQKSFLVDTESKTCHLISEIQHAICNFETQVHTIAKLTDLLAYNPHLMLLLLSFEHLLLI